MTALWGLLAAVTSPRAAIAAAGLLLLATPLLLPRRGCGGTTLAVRALRDGAASPPA